MYRLSLLHDGFVHADAQHRRCIRYCRTALLELSSIVAQVAYGDTKWTMSSISLEQSYDSGA